MAMHSILTTDDVEHSVDIECVRESGEFCENE